MTGMEPAERASPGLRRPGGSLARGAGAQSRGSGWCERPLADAGATSGELLRDIFAARPARTLRAIPGRATFLWPADETVVVKRYGGTVLGDLLHDLARGRGARSPARREGENLRELAALGLPVPRVLGWCEERAGWAGRSAVWMERIPHELTLRQLAEGDASAAFARFAVPLARLVARLHATGWYHRDLYLEHWIVSAYGLALLDVGRARRERAPRERWFVKDVAALLHSSPAALTPRERLRFLALYLDARGLQDRGCRRAFARSVAAKARRIAAHEPRHVDRTSPA